MVDCFYVRISRDGSAIASSEWDAVVAADSELKPVDTLTGRNPMTGEVVHFAAPHSAVWMGHPEGIRFTFKFDGGNVVCQSLDEIGVLKAEQIASQLRGTVHSTID